jgi:hypothetical protein
VFSRLKKLAQSPKGITGAIVLVIWYLNSSLDLIGKIQTVEFLAPYAGKLKIDEIPHQIGNLIGDHFGLVLSVLVGVGLIAWSANDIAREEKEDPRANIVLVYATLRFVAIGDRPYNWENATTNVGIT